MTAQYARPRKIWNTRTTGLLAANTLADFGFWIDFLVILAMSAYTYQGSGFTMALVSALFLVPGMVFGTTVGRWLDNSDPGKAIVIGLALRTLVSVVLLMQPSLWLFCICVALRSTFTLIINPGFNVVVSRVVPKEDVPTYFGGLGLMRNVVKITAPFIGTATASQFGDASALSLSIALSMTGLVVSAFCAFGTKPPAPKEPAGHGETIAPPVAAVSSAESTAHGGQDRLLVQFLVTVTVFAFVVFFINNQLPVLLRDAGFDKALLGALVSCSGAGGILASLYMMKRSSVVKSGDPMTATTVAVGATALSFVVLGLMFLLPHHVAPYGASVVFFCTGVCASIEAIRSNTVIVQHFGAQTGEISGKVGAYSNAAMLGAPWLAALVIPFTTLPSLLIVDGLVGLAVLSMVVLKYGSVASTRRAVAN